MRGVKVSDYTSLLVSLTIFITSGIIGGILAVKWNRNRFLYFFLGFFLGLIGIAIIVLIGKKKEIKNPEASTTSNLSIQK
jgi:uncharacterized membrane protein YgaE (UPF0421/DUF939 family)